MLVPSASWWETYNVKCANVQILFGSGPRDFVSGSWEMIQAERSWLFGNKNNQEGYNHHPYLTGTGEVSTIQDAIARTEAEIAIWNKQVV